MFGFECKELFQVSFICILLKLALNTVNAGVHGDLDCDSPQHLKARPTFRQIKLPVWSMMWMVFHSSLDIAND